MKPGRRKDRIEGERNRESERDTLKRREQEKGWVAFQC